VAAAPTEKSASREKVAIYPGSFDPLTNGHLDLIARASRLFDHLIVAVLTNTGKQPLFPVAERIEMIRQATDSYSNVEVDFFEGLLVDYAARRNADAILRGIRAVSDYESELQMAHRNRRLRAQTETVFLLSTAEYSFISSRMIKEIITLGGDVSQFVPDLVLQRLRAKFS
jgi:pantetheine-phosphate adenylyltransferase